MKPPPFGYVVPTTAAEAVDALSDLGEEAKILAGGQSLVPMLALRLARPEHLVDLNRVDELAGTSRQNRTLRVGAMTRDSALERDPTIGDAVPLLAAAAPHIGHFQIRNRGTVGGSLAHADPAAELPAVALALDAEFEILNRTGSRSVAAADFFVSTFVTALDVDDLLVAIRFPIWGAGSGFVVDEIARRHGDFALAGVACGVQIESDRISRTACALFGMGSTPVRLDDVERELVGAAPSDVDFEALGRSAVADLDPLSDVHASARYRKRISASLVASGLSRAVARATA